MFGVGPAQNPFGTPCDACRARDAHIDDLRRLLNDERAQRNRVFQMAFPQMPAASPDAVSEGGVINRRAPSLVEARRLAEQKERDIAPDANQQYWAKKKEHYEKIERELNEKIANAVQRKASDKNKDSGLAQFAPGPAVGDDGGPGFPEQDIRSERDEDRRTLDG